MKNLPSNPNSVESGLLAGCHLFLSLLAIIGAFVPGPVIATEKAKPDIVVVLCDDLNPFYTGFAGDPDAETPNLDALAAESVVFTQCYTASPVCMSSRTAIVTGLYPHNTGAWGNANELFVPPTLTSLFSDFKATGYATSVIGKTHWFAGRGFRSQFDSLDDYYKGIGVDHIREVATTFSSRNGKGRYQDFLQEIGKFEAQSADLTERLATNQYVARKSLLKPDESCDWMMTDLALEYFSNAPTDEPFAMMVGFSNPHSPFDPAGKYADLYDPESLHLRANVSPFKKYSTDYDLAEIRKARAAYLGKISFLDDLLGKLVTALKERGNWDNTVLVFTADHGMAVGEHRNIAKGQFWEEVSRVPMVMRIPGITAEGISSDALCQTIDLYPTLIELAGGVTSPHVLGRSLAPIIAGKTDSVRDAVFSEIQHDGILDYMVRTNRYKWFTDKGRESLYDLGDDPFEQTNLIGLEEHHKVSAQMRDRLRTFLMTEQVNHAAGYEPMAERVKKANESRSPNVLQTNSSAPIETIYSNDTTHIFSCLRPEVRRESAFTDELLAKSITEAAGVDAHFLQPGLGWIPWWKSEIYSPAEHYRWLQETHGVKGVDKIGQYLLDGGDMLETLVKTCATIGAKPFLSFRLNDGHHTRDLVETLERGRPKQTMSRHYWDNYERFRIGSDLENWDEAVFDWAIPEVRDHKFALIEEACANYDLAGLELDFLRHWVRFKSDLPEEERREITTNFVRRIREMLDRTAATRNLPPRQLCIRVPANPNVRPEQGIDLAALVEAGVEMINLSNSYFTWQDDSVAAARMEAGKDVSIFLEMTHCTMTGKATNGSGTQPFLRTTDEQFYTTATMAYEQGATGVSLFNFPYYRYHVTDDIGPFHEPPFHVIPKLKDRDFLSRQTPSYFLSSGRKDRILGERTLPAIMNRREDYVFEMPVSQTMDITTDGILRLRSDENIEDREFKVLCGDHVLEEIEFVDKPLPHSYDDAWLGTAENTRCFSLPKEALDGKEAVSITIRVLAGIRVRLIYMDLTFPKT